MNPMRPGPPPRRRPPRRRDPVELLTSTASMVVVSDSDDVGLALIDPAREVLVESCRSGQRFASADRPLIEDVGGWLLEVRFTETETGRWTVRFHLEVPTKELPWQLAFEEHRPDAETDRLAAVLRLRLQCLSRPWSHRHIEVVADVIHAELHGCAAVDVEGHPTPRGGYLEVPRSTTASARLVRHAARLNGFELRFEPHQRLALDSGADWIDDDEAFDDADEPSDP